MKNACPNYGKSLANLSAFVYDTHCVQEESRGELAEWSKAHDWKSCLRETVTRVQIPNSPPKKSPISGAFFIFYFVIRSGKVRTFPCVLLWRLMLESVGMNQIMFRHSFWQRFLNDSTCGLSIGAQSQPLLSYDFTDIISTLLHIHMLNSFVLCSSLSARSCYEYRATNRSS